MPRSFDIPQYYRSQIISTLRSWRRSADPQKRNLAPTTLTFPGVEFRIARHFGLCFGVENAIEIAYQALKENPDRPVFLLSEIIHNSRVNDDLKNLGVRFLTSAEGEELIPLESISPDDVVIVPAFGTTVENFERFRSLGLDTRRYNTTCPFVEKVWKRAHELGQQGFTIVIHGKHSHEETRATFSHAQVTAPSVIIRDIEEGRILADFIVGKISADRFREKFSERCSEGFDPDRDLQRIGVVNQTTMLATETREISALLRMAMLERYGKVNIAHHFADTRDTLCYATSENQMATYALTEAGGDLALVVGGYNSSNTSHLVELCEEHLPTYHIQDEYELLDRNAIRHFSFRTDETRVSKDWLPSGEAPVTILVTAGASCPDSIVDRVLTRTGEFFGLKDSDWKAALSPFRQKAPETPLTVLTN